jgi:hypothetical protein
MSGIYPDLINIGQATGFRTQYGGFTLDPGSEVRAYVRATQPANMPGDMANLWVADIPSALARCRSGRNDVVIVLPGHTENVTSTTFTNLVPGTRLVGAGRGSNRPNLRWTATTSQLVMNDADVVISNFILRMEGAVVVKAIVVTAADCGIYNCDIDVGSTAATNLSTIGIEIGAGADRFELRSNYIHSIAGATPTTVVSVAGVSDGVVICDNKIMAATSAVGVGVIHVTAAATGLDIGRNLLQNRVASSETCVSATAVACTGVVYDNYCATEAGTPVSDIIELNAASLLRLFQNFGTDTKNTSGLLTPAVVT